MNKWIDRLFIIFAFGAFFALFLFSGCASKSSPAKQSVQPPALLPTHKIKVYLHQDSKPFPQEALQKKLAYFINRTNQFCIDKGKEGVHSIMVLHKGNDEWQVSYVCIEDTKEVEQETCPLEEKYCE